VQVSVGNAEKLRRAFFVTGKHPARRLLPEQTLNSNNQSGPCIIIIIIIIISR